MTKRLTVDAPAAVDEESLSEQNIAAYEALAAVLDNLGDSEAVLKIMRRAKTGGMEFCEQIAADANFSPQYIKDNWGGGVYGVQLWGPKPGETGTKYLKSVTVKIAGAPKEKKEPEPERAVAGGADPSLISLQLELATLKGMLAGMQTAKASEGGSPLDNLEKLTTVMKNLMPAAPMAAGNPSEMLAFVREAMELGRSAVGGGDGEGTPWGTIIEKAVEPALGLIGQALAAQNAGVHGTPVPVPVTETPPAGTAPALQPGTPMWQAELAKIVPRLLRRAREGKSPELAADLFLEDAPGGVVLQLGELAKEPEFVMTTLALAEQYFPEVKEVRGWVEMFLKAVQEGLVEEEAAPPVGTPALTVEVVDKPKKKKGGPDA